MARKPVKNSVKCHNIKSRTVWCSSNSTPKMYPVYQLKSDKSSENNEHFLDVNQANGTNCEVKVSPVVVTTGKQCSNGMVTAKVISHPDMSGKEFTQMQVHLNDQNRVNPGSKNKNSRL